MSKYSNEEEAWEIESHRVRAERVLGLNMSCTDIGPCTIRHYLTTLLQTVWKEKEGFSGERPFGNSDWHWQECIHEALVKEELIDGELDDCDNLKWCVDSDANAIIDDAIFWMCGNIVLPEPPT